MSPLDGDPNSGPYDDEAIVDALMSTPQPERLVATMSIRIPDTGLTRTTVSALCPACNGCGGTQELTGNEPDGTATSEMRDCDTCGTTGRVDVVMHAMPGEVREAALLTGAITPTELSVGLLDVEVAVVDRVLRWARKCAGGGR